jgi:glycosyltransferase involved in cell wall biosynthesis
VALADVLGGRPVFLSGGALRASKVLIPLRYAFQAACMCRLLEREKPDVVLVITPPVFAPLVGWVWCAWRRRRLVLDCHTETFHARNWGWASALHRLILRNAQAALVHTEEALRLTSTWKANVLLLPDDVPDPTQAEGEPVRGKPYILVAGGLDKQEPVAAALDAARILGDVEVRFTGDERRVPDRVRLMAPPNAVFTGYLKYPRFLAELLAADVVAAFSLDPHIMNRAAFEAIGLGCPLVLSDLPGLRQRFGDAALFATNDPHSMAATLRQALHDKEDLSHRSRRAQVRLRAQHRDAVRQLRVLLNANRRSA